MSKQTISNCFQHGGFLKVENDFDSDDDLPWAKWLKKVGQEDDNNILDNLPCSENEFNEFVHIDDNLVSVEYLDDDAIVASVSSLVYIDDDEEAEDEESVSTELRPVPTTSEALQHIDNVRHFLQSRNTPQSVLNRLAEVELHINDIHFIKIKQTKIKDFFKLDS